MIAANYHYVVTLRRPNGVETAKHFDSMVKANAFIGEQKRQGREVTGIKRAYGPMPKVGHPPGAQDWKREEG